MKPNFTITASLAFAIGLLTAIAATPASSAQPDASGAEMITNGPQATPGDVQGAGSGSQNVRDSQRYEALVHTSPGYRAAREQKECGPIADPQLHQNCIASFGR